MTKYLVCGYNKKTVDDWGAKVKILAILDSIDEVENFEEILGQTRIENKTKFGEKWVTWVFKVDNKVQVPPIDIRETANAMKPRSLYD